MPCLICGGETKPLQDKQMSVLYHVCSQCEFIFKDESNRLGVEDESTEYDRHDNTMESTGYVNIFRELIKSYITPLKISRKVLEFGSGPGPVLYQLLQESGYDVTQYDPFYHSSTSYRNKTYQLITSTEVVEHFFDPVKEFKHLSSILEQGGYLLIMTHLRKMDLDQFLTWWYRRDITHVGFYHLNTFAYIAKICGLTVVKHNDKNIILFQKK
jgi:2-polyprenyl-3-methyl-5-hydroxy-6-metoxy-1,4-benzoquinol methylase